MSRNVVCDIMEFILLDKKKAFDFPIEASHKIKSIYIYGELISSILNDCYNKEVATNDK